ncbi:mariner mos1 transposase [Trichonephila clavipes]|nr:mariner mos1 transposase [Trichonephila clavipes]
MFEYDPESKRQSCEWHTKSSPRPKKAQMSKSRIKTIIIVFFDIRGPQGQTLNPAFYLEVLRRLKRRIARVRTDIKDMVKLHHDNATSHTAFIITNFLARINIPVIPHPPYIPDLAPCAFFFVSATQERDERKTLGNRGKHPTPCYNVSEIHSRRGVSGCLSGVETRLRKCIDAG